MKNNNKSHRGLVISLPNPNPKLNETEPFRLCNFFWKQKDENQLELINE